MLWRVAVYAEGLGEWVQVGPAFADEREAVRFLDAILTPFKRLVQVGEWSGAERRRLEFARYLVQAGRLSEAC